MAHAFLAPCVGHEENHDASGESECLPALLALLVPVLDRQMVRVVEYQGRGVEAHAVFRTVALILALVPLEPHDRIVVTQA